MKKQDNCYLAIDAGGSFLKAALSNNDGTILHDSFLKAPIDSNGSVTEIKKSYKRITLDSVKWASSNNLKIGAMGICIPGPFNYEDGICLMKHKYLSIYGIPMRPWFIDIIGNVPIRFIHDSTAYILGAIGQDDRYENFERLACVIIGTGLGFASIFNKKVFSNPQGGPGISIYARPYKGKTAEEYVSRRGIIKNYVNSLTSPILDIDVIDIANFAYEGQKEAIDVFKRTGYNLAKILYDIIDKYKFECLLLGGAISKSSDLFLSTLSEGLSGLNTLSLIDQISNMDIVPLIGTIHALINYK